jgi:hypothetical protein
LRQLDWLLPSDQVLQSLWDDRKQSEGILSGFLISRNVTDFFSEVGFDGSSSDFMKG